MNKDIKIAGATYSGVPAIQIPATDGGTVRYTEVSDTTATAEDVIAGKVFYDADGVKTEGIGSSSSSRNDILVADNVELTDDDFPAAAAGTLELKSCPRNVMSIVSDKIGKICSGACDFYIITTYGHLTSLQVINMPYVTEIESNALVRANPLRELLLPSLKKIPQDGIKRIEGNRLEKLDLSSVTTIANRGLYIITTTLNKQKYIKEFSFPALREIGYQGIYQLGNISACATLAKFPSIETIGNSGLSNLYAYTIDLGENLKSVGMRAIDTGPVNKLVIRAVTPPVASSSQIVNVSSSNKLVIYVPDDSLEAYKTATNWSNYASYYAPLSEYVEDAT